MRLVPIALLLFVSACSPTAVPVPSDASTFGDAASPSDAHLADASRPTDDAALDDAATGPADAAACPVGDGTPSAQS